MKLTEIWARLKSPQPNLNHYKNL